ncbi:MULTISPECIES: hypothetical protein [unclassified Brevundimonas]|uniref:hypothetical protein n=1 Tax=unclassified Brevundimonas TaxID=2622653 RepID=UPI0006F3CB58|nr:MULTISPECIES: hypothetical protein [unclassified Brevundimonas]KQY95629.1 hypothetical protein ASD25_16625 [Brevundimonas sp. Root1423]KRA29245.1 hypothetical protein ASD59_05560 [Brevundimonas sp. Root608]
MRSIDNRRVILSSMIVASAGSLWANGLFTITDRAWVIMGTPPEVHPEWLYLLAGLPLALTALTGFSCSLWARFVGRPGRGLELVVLALSTTALAASIQLLCVPFLEKGQQPARTVPQIIANVIFLGPGLLLLIQIVLGLWLVLQAAKMAPRRSPANVR